LSKGAEFVDAGKKIEFEVPNPSGNGKVIDIFRQTDNAFVEECYSWITVDSGNALAVDQAETQALTTAVANIDIDGTSIVGVLVKGFVLTHATLACNVDEWEACFWYHLRWQYPVPLLNSL